MTAPVERQEVCLLARQPRGHVDFVRVGGEMHQGPLLELEQRRARITVLLVLPDRVTPILAGAGVLQLDGGHRQPVHRQNHVQRAIVAGMTRHLARQREPVLAEQPQHLEVRAVGRLEVRQPKRFPVELEPVPQHMQRAFGVQFLDQRVDQQRLQPRRVQRLHLAPKPALRVRDEREHLRREQRPLLVPLAGAAGLPAAAREEDFLHVGFKGSLCSLSGHAVIRLRSSSSIHL